MRKKFGKFANNPHQSEIPAINHSKYPLITSCTVTRFAIMYGIIITHKPMKPTNPEKTASSSCLQPCVSAEGGRNPTG